MYHDNYDVIVAGAGFAGLSVASRVKGKILLIDRSEIGERQTSACGLPLEAVERAGCAESVLHVSNVISLHVNKNAIDFRFKNPYCTVDFKKFCRLLNSQNHARFLKANVLGVEKGDSFAVHTSAGSYRAGIVVDATGWNSALARSVRPGFVNNDMLMFGIETEIEYRCKEFHIYYEPDFAPDAMIWIFPCGKFSRFGIAGYYGRAPLLLLNSFLNRFGLKRGKIHGGFINYCFRDPVVDGMFIVGDGQGQTLPLTGEGIRRCLKYGAECGNIIQKVLNGRIDSKKALKEYSKFALKAKNGYNLMLKAQNRFLKMPVQNIEKYARFLSKGPAIRAFEKRYLNI